jgi:hypothetical protein
MEKDFYTDDFEQLLKDTTDDFRMYPSRKVWHSIYNDLHPARKWPSFAVCLLLITSILYIGIHNNNSINAGADNLFLSALTPPAGTDKDIPPRFSSSANRGTNEADVPGLDNSRNGLKNQKQALAGNDFSVRLVSKKHTQNDVALHPNVLPGKLDLAGPEASVKSPDALAVNPLPVNLSAPAESITISDVPGQTTEESALIHRVPGSTNTITGLVATQVGPTGAIEGNKTLPVAPGVSALKIRNAEETIWIEDYSFHNKRNSDKWKAKLSTLVYFTPSVGYRIFNKNNSFEPVNALLIRSSATSVDADDAISQQAALSMESGASVLLDLTKKLKVKAGIQINYNNYISYAQRLNHPSSANLLLNDLNTGNTYLVPYNTIYGNKSGDNLTRLNNKTIQFSVPIGADYKLAGNDKLKWYIGATLQPTYVAGGNAYLISSDYKNYIDMPSMLRSWNLNAGFESFVSYKTKSGSYINLGPQFRYQLLSTYSNRYTYSENLYNIGIKLGIMRKL